MLSIVSEMGRETLPIGVEIKALNSAELDITKSEATVWTVIVSALVPLIVAAIGTAVYHRRRHSCVITRIKRYPLFQDRKTL